DEPTPHVDWGSGHVRLLAEPVEWRAVGRPRRAGVSSFGISGTNAHLILEQPPPTTHQPAAGKPAADGGWPVVWPVSAKSEVALRAQAVRLRAFLDGLGDDALMAAGQALATTRAAFEHRAVVIGANRAEIAAGLEALVADLDGSVPRQAPRGAPQGVPRDVVRGVVRGGKLACLFPGQGAQRLGMGRELYNTFPVFAAAFDEVATHFDPALRGIMWGRDPDLLNR
ncbi:ketoacyl-synthetase C-terminal extension domain-containing protein, partial [Nonomuraea sp. NPDC048916]|uniref:ketoacyl-synthetase C-terminal extension domain-containing protein n=1 Tax=Nonomuraea sp. NPDC048916 TaxID=3154232 RepID=UPI0033D33B19